MAAVRDATARRPAVFLQHRQRPQVLDQAVAEGAVELEPVAVAGASRRSESGCARPGIEKRFSPVASGGA